MSRLVFCDGVNDERSSLQRSGEMQKTHYRVKGHAEASNAKTTYLGELYSLLC